MAEADPFQFILLMLASAVIGWLLCRWHYSDRIAHWRDKADSKEIRRAEAESELEKQKRLTKKQKDAHRPK